jgi:hypothetical protein
MNPFKMFKNYEEAKKEAQKTGAKLWDTHSLPERWGVGEPTIEMEEDEDNQDWEILD